MDLEESSSPAEEPAKIDRDQSVGAPHKDPAVEGGHSATQTPLRGPSTGVIVGSIVVLILVVGGALTGLALTGALDRLLGLGGPGSASGLGTVAAVPTLPPEWTATPSPTVMPSRTPGPAQEASPEPTPAGLEVDLAARALRQMAAGNYQGAIDTWGEILDQDPENHEAYYRRAYSTLWLTRNLGIWGEYVALSQAALADADRAIALSSEPNGDYYLARSWAFENLGLSSYYRVDHDRQFEVALENMRVGLSLPHSEPTVIYAPVGLLLGLGRCDEALTEIERLEEERGIGIAPSPTLNYYRGIGLLCNGQYQEALGALVVASDAHFDCRYAYQQAVALYFLGRDEEALELLTDLITGCPLRDGYRYYLRALILYERGDTEQATADLELGSFDTWDWRGLKAYVEARMLFNEGQREEAIERMQLAEATFERVRGPFLNRIQSELAALGGQPDPRTPVPSPNATPIPPLPAGHPTPFPLVRVLHDEGSGPLEIAPGETLALHFRGPSSFTIHIAKILHVHLVSAEGSGATGLEMLLFDPHDQRWVDFEPRWGQNPIAAPDRFFYGSGDLFIRITNPGQQAVAIDDLGLFLSLVDDYGETVTWSFLET